MNDPVADMLIRIKNGYLARLKEVAIPYSKLKVSLANLLASHGYVESVESDESSRKLSVKLLYHDGVPAMTDVRRISKPGLRRYIGYKELSTTFRGLGHVILSTSRGLKTHKEARKDGFGGEMLCRIW